MKVKIESPYDEYIGTFDSDVLADDFMREHYNVTHIENFSRSDIQEGKLCRLYYMPLSVNNEVEVYSGVRVYL